MRRLLLMLLALAAGGAGAADVTSLAPDELLVTALAPGGSPERRALKDAATAELLARGPASLRDLVARIDTENVMVGVLAQQLVDQLPAERAVPVLREFLDAASTNQQRVALFFLGFYRAPELAPRVLALLPVDKLRGAGVRALGKWGVAAALPALGAALSDTNERIRVAAANALRDVGDPRALPLLAPALGDAVFTVRNTALRGMVRYGPAAEPVLIDALASSDRRARRQAVRGLGEVGGRRAERALRTLRPDGADAALRRDVETALGRIAARSGRE